MFRILGGRTFCNKNSLKDKKYIAQRSAKVEYVLFQTQISKNMFGKEALSGLSLGTLEYRLFGDSDDYE